MPEHSAKVAMPGDTIAYGVPLNAAILAWMNDVAPHGIIVTDAELKIQAWNRWLEIHTHRRAEEMIGRHIAEILPGYVEHRIDSYYEAALNGQTSILSQKFHTHIFPIPMPGGARFMRQSAYVASLSLGEHVVGTLTVIEDVTERVSREVELQSKAEDIARLLTSEQAARVLVDEANTRLEERVQERTRELMEVNSALESFSYTVSHDLRAPLRSMLGFAQALEEDYGHTLGDAAKEFINLIVTNARDMDRLIQDLLNYSRLTRAELALEPVSVRDALEAAKASLDSQIVETHAVIELSNDLPKVVAHRTTLIQIFSNLLANAMKFVDGAKVPRVSISAEELDGRVRIWIEDNGIGIREQDYQRIFEVFQRLHSSEQYGGTGIGLALVLKGIERMGGSCGVASELGSGSRFWIELATA